jgi:hypothetical protein
LKKRVDQIDQLAVVAVDQGASGVKIIGPRELRHEISLHHCLQTKCGCGYAPESPLLTCIGKFCARLAQAS